MYIVEGMNVACYNKSRILKIGNHIPPNLNFRKLGFYLIFYNDWTNDCFLSLTECEFPTEVAQSQKYTD